MHVQSQLFNGRNNSILKDDDGQDSTTRKYEAKKKLGSGRSTLYNFHIQNYKEVLSFEKLLDYIYRSSCHHAASSSASWHIPVIMQSHHERSL
jgi:hypothetical protein